MAKHIVALPEGAGVPIFGLDNRLANIVTEATREHERIVAKEYTWPALPSHLRGMPDARAMVRHWVRTDYQWKP
jgi:hypothetical protein